MTTSIRRIGILPAAALLVLVAASAVLRTRAIANGYWIDEGLTIGIASHSPGEIPGLLVHDGSPPLHYLVMWAWTSLFGTAEVAARTSSLLCALATIPAALWAGRAVFGPRAGWAAAAVAATAPLLTAYAQEARMYALMALLSVLASGTFVLAFVRGSRRALVAFVALGVALLYTHNWGAYLLLGLACALPVAARARHPGAVAREAAGAGLVLALAYLPWVPTLIEQARHTGAPWSTTPGVDLLTNAATVPLGGGTAADIAIAVAAAGLAVAGTRRGSDPAVWALLVALVMAGTAGWLGAQVEPGWADRYMTVFVGPVVLLVGAGLAAAGRAGALALAVVVMLSVLHTGREQESNVQRVARATAPLMQPGDLVVLTHPEQVAAVRHYMPGGLRWATALGPVRDPRAFDWRDAVARLRAAEPRRTLDRLLARPPRRIALFRPTGMRPGGPVWLDLVARRAARWDAIMARDPRLRRVVAHPASDPARRSTDLQSVVYEVRTP